MGTEMTDIDFQQLLADYWDAAYAEGKEGRTNDTKEGVAQQTLNAINAYVESLRQRVDAFESLETKRMKDAVTADDWKRIAEAMEYNYRCCSEGFNKTCGELRQQLGDVFDEKKILSQRVEELEVMAISRLREQVIKDFAQIDRNEEELAARKGITAFNPNNAASNVQSGILKQSQGEPVRLYPGGGAFPIIPVSAPTIPEGWQVVTEPDAIGMGRLIVNGKYYGLPMEVINWLAVAPKPEEQNQLRANIWELPKSEDVK